MRSRGQHPNDHKLFSEKSIELFREAVLDFSFLLTREYGATSVLELVGNRYKLNKRQRMALSRMCASSSELESRADKILSKDHVKGKRVELDGFNLLILLESALSGGYIFKGQDGCYRDIGSVHGTYKRVAQTRDSAVLIGKSLNELEVTGVHWFLDSPVSNSGRLKTFLRELAEEYNFPWSIELVFSPDKELAKSKEIVISSDGWILNECDSWFNLGAHIIEHHPNRNEFHIFDPLDQN